MKLPQQPYEIVDAILQYAVEHEASDIYWLPGAEQYQIKLRIAGRQSQLTTVPLDSGLQCITRIKVLAGLLTYRSQIDQDGVIHDYQPVSGSEFRVAVMPTIHGERITLRIQTKSRQPQHLEELNFSAPIVAQLKTMLQKQHGMIVLTGPTGCGKTTTIYAMIRELLRNDQDPASIISIEDPVECRIEGISQVSLGRSSDEWNYTQALRAALRQDVKTLIIGEMRDPEIVKVALEAAMTGHRVITTFHAGDIPAVYTRILHQGFEPFLVASAITGIVSQRLLPTLEPDKLIPVVAVMEPDERWQELILNNGGLGELRQAVKAYPLADLTVAAEQLVEQKRIDAKQVYAL